MGELRENDSRDNELSFDPVATWCSNTPVGRLMVPSLSPFCWPEVKGILGGDRTFLRNIFIFVVHIIRPLLKIFRKGRVLIPDPKSYPVWLFRNACQGNGSKTTSVIMFSRSAGLPFSYGHLLKFPMSYYIPHRLSWFVLVAITFPMSCTTSDPLGIFEGTTNVGDAPLGGGMLFERFTNTYIVNGSGADIYGASDEFFFV